MNTPRALFARLFAAAAAAFTTFAVLIAVVSISEPSTDTAQQLATIAAPAVR